MSTFAYNDIALSMVQLLAYRRRMRFDGAVYLWSEHVLTVQGVYSPETTSYRIVGNDPNNLERSAGHNPAITDTLIRHQLSQPRGRLVFTAAGTNLIGQPNLFVDGLANEDLTILESPPPGEGGLSTGPASSFVIDCQNGPKVLSQDVKRIVGTRSWLVTITVLAHVNESYRYYSSPAVLLSHQWSQTEDVDADGWSTRTVRGHAIFRTDRLTQLQATPDSYREALGHPIPDNTQRVGIQISVDESGSRVDYRFQDRHMSHRLIGPNITRIAATATVFHGTPGTVGFAKAAIGVGGAAIAGNVSGAVKAGSGFLPTRHHVIDIRIWGNEKSTRKELLRTALKILQVKKPSVPLLDAFPITPQQGMSLTVDLLGHFISLRVSFELGGVTTFSNLATDPLSTLNPADPGLFDFASDKLEQQIPELMDMEIQNVATTLNQPGRAPVPGKVARGSWLGTLVSQALGSVNQNPGAPRLPSAPEDIPIPDVE
jgi:hypothetical protein